MKNVMNRRRDWHMQKIKINTYFAVLHLHFVPFSGIKDWHKSVHSCLACESQFYIYLCLHEVKTLHDAWQPAWAQFQVFFSPALILHCNVLSWKIFKGTTDLVPLCSAKRISSCEMLIMLFAWSKCTSHLLNDVFLTAYKWVLMLFMEIVLGDVKWIIELLGQASLLWFITGLSCQACVHLSRLWGLKKTKNKYERRGGCDVLKVITCRKTAERRSSLVTNPSTKCNSNKRSADRAVLYITTCETHLHAHSLHHPPGISVPYLSKHTHRCVPCPSDGILKKVNHWRVLLSAKIIHLDESVHILKVSSLKPFGGINFHLDMK